MERGDERERIPALEGAMGRIAVLIYLIFLLISDSSSFSQTLDASPIKYTKIKTILGYDGDITSVSFSPGGNMMATGVHGRKIYIWDVQSWQITSVLEAEDDVSTITFSPDGKSFVAGDIRGKVYVWGTAGWKRAILSICKWVGPLSYLPPPANLIGIRGHINTVTFNPGGNLLAVACNQQTVLWDIQNGKLHRKFGGHKGDVLKMVFSPDGKRISTGSDDNTVIIWDIGSGNQVNVLTGHTNNVQALVYSPDGNYLISGANDNVIIVWNAKTGEFIRSLKNHKEGICHLMYVPGTNILLSADCMMTLPRVFAMSDRKSIRGCNTIFWDVEKAQPIRSMESDCALTGIAFSPDSRYLVAAHPSGGRFITVFERK